MRLKKCFVVFFLVLPFATDAFSQQSEPLTTPSADRVRRNEISLGLHPILLPMLGAADALIRYELMYKRQIGKRDALRFGLLYNSDDTDGNDSFDGGNVMSWGRERLLGVKAGYEYRREGRVVGVFLGVDLIGGMRMEDHNWLSREQAIGPDSIVQRQSSLRSERGFLGVAPHAGARLFLGQRQRFSLSIQIGFQFDVSYGRYRNQLWETRAGQPAQLVDQGPSEPDYSVILSAIPWINNVGFNFHF